jgi:cell division protein FtsZ
MKGMGDALMGAGIGEGENRAVIAAESAIHSPLLDDISIAGAKGILINITGGEDMTLYDVSDATQTVQDAVGQDADSNIIFGAVIDPEMKGKVQVTVIATGFNEMAVERPARPERSAIRLTLPMQPVTANPEAQGEQMSIDLTEKASLEKPAVQRQVIELPAARITCNDAEEDGVGCESVPAPVAVNDDLDTREIQCVSKESTRIMHIEKPVEQSFARPRAESARLEMPIVVRKDSIQREQVCVSKSGMMTSMEEDLDVPTFLRKQMQ